MCLHSSMSNHHASTVYCGGLDRTGLDWWVGPNWNGLACMCLLWFHMCSSKSQEPRDTHCNGLDWSWPDWHGVDWFTILHDAVCLQSSVSVPFLTAMPVMQWAGLEWPGVDWLRVLSSRLPMSVPDGPIFHDVVCLQSSSACPHSDSHVCNEMEQTRR